MLRGAFVFLALCSTASAGLIDLNGKPIDEFTFALEGRLWRSELGGSIRVEENSFGTLIEFDEDLNLDSAEEEIEGVILFRAKSLLIRGAYVEATFKDTETLERSFTFAGTTFSVSESVEAETTFRIGGVEVEWLLLNVGSAAKIGLEIGLGIGARYLSVSAEFHSETTGISERERKNTVVPVISASASLGVMNFLRLDANLAGLWFDYLGIEGLFLDGSISAKLFLYHSVWVGLGYRYAGLDLEFNHGDDFEIDVSLSGVFVALGVQF
ncbi:MAG: hypothetical protein HYY18_07895 [Planctomycetes bacterium]|nr:hypothetical protein [Planctomycetota bacterium]